MMSGWWPGCCCGCEPATLLTTFCGANASGSMGATESYDPGGNSWTSESAMPSSKTAVGSTSDESFAYSIQGSSTDGMLSPGAANSLFCKSTRSWETGTNAPYSASHLGNDAAYDDSRVDSWCGTLSGGTLSSSHYSYELSTWTSRTGVTTRSYATSASPGNGYLYQIGGLSSGAFAQSSNFQYNKSGNSWSSKTSLPTALFGAQVMTDFSNLIAIAGGVTAIPTFITTTYLYSESGNSWSTGSSLGQNKHYGAGMCDSTNGYVTCGLYNTGGLNPYTAVTEKYTFSGSWSAVTSAPTARKDLGAGG